MSGPPEAREPTRRTPHPCARIAAMNPSPTSILAFRNGSIGNTLVAVPALRALHHRFPDARISVVVDNVGAELLRPCPWIAELITYDKRGRDRGAGGWLRLVARLRARRPSHAVLFKRFFRNGLLARLSGAPVRAGFVTNGSAPFLNVTIPYDEDTSITRLNLRLAARIGAGHAAEPEAEDDATPQMWLTDEDRRGADAWRAEHGLAGAPLVAAHYGGLSTPPTFLSAGAFGSLARAMAGRDRRVVLLGAGDREEAWARQVAATCPGAVRGTGLPLRTAAALIAGADLFVGFNSGPAHMAAAVGTPARIVFRPGPEAQREITKWLPVTAAAQALVPPDAGDAAALDAWIADAAATAGVEAPGFAR